MTTGLKGRGVSLSRDLCYKKNYCYYYMYYYNYYCYYTLYHGVMTKNETLATINSWSIDLARQEK